jgi:CobQ-like glutamine amidotransferase family enzyme
MKLTIAHLYYDIMNLYGESGNVKALKKYLEEQGITVTIKFVTIDEDKEFDKYDIVYIGSGIEANRLLVLKDILMHKEEISTAIENNKFYLCTGNSYELFGKYNGY